MANVLFFVLFALGIVLIVKGGDYFVDAAVWLSEISGIPKLVIGATVVSVATTLPELLVSSFAAAEGKSDMAIGNAVGSVTCNVALIMALSMIFIPIAIKRKEFAPKALLMMAAAALVWIFSLSGTFGFLGTILLICVFVVFMTVNIIEAKKAVGKTKEEKDPELKSKKSIITNILKFVFGAAGIVIGADLLVDNGSEIARLFGVSEAIISVTIIAIGTSLPELVTTITAIVKKQGNLSVGNIIGANVLDLTLIMPICSLLSGGTLAVGAQALKIDFLACAVVMGIAVIPTLIFSKLSRWQGFALIAVYISYIVLLCIYFV